MSYGRCRAYPMKSKREAHDALSKAFKQAELPTNLVIANTWEVMKQNKFTHKCKKDICCQHMSEPHL